MKPLCVALLLFMAVQASCQDSTTTPKAVPKIYRNEVGIDITGMLRQFLNFGVEYIPNYDPVYFISYRRHIKKSNFRLGVGGSFMRKKLQPFSNQDPKPYYSSSYGASVRLGYEFYTDIGKRWQLFYGADLRPSFVYMKNEAQFANGNYIAGYEAYEVIYGLAPILGFRFKIAPLVSLLAETNFSVNFRQNFTKRFYHPRYPGATDLPENISEKGFEISGTYMQPLSLLLTFDL